MSALSAGLAQRARALAAFVVDAYGPREIVSAGIVPVALIEEAEGYEPELRGRWPSGQAPLGVVGIDVVRDRDGQLRVLEDNARTPSGFAYAVAARGRRDGNARWSRALLSATLRLRPCRSSRPSWRPCARGCGMQRTLFAAR